LSVYNTFHMALPSLESVRKPDCAVLMS
jgi:hypothetical protein